MAFSGETLNVTELDFDAIKSNLVEHFKNNDNTFTDWAFEGSNLNTLIDVLAYNTHYSALLAHLSLNESFIDSAQLRSSVVSAAKLLGYVPRSFSASSASLDAEFVAADGAPDTFLLPRGTRFSTTVDDLSYTYVILDENNELTKSTVGDTDYYNTDPDAPIVVHQGRLVTTSFLANSTDDGERYQIEDEDIDVSTLIVKVFPTANKTVGSATVFRQYADISVTADSAIYFLNENTHGRYELTFGNGIFGRKLSAGNVIEIEYLVTKGAAPNGAKPQFILQQAISQIYSTSYITLYNDSSITGGSGKEDVARLKQNAVNSFVTQNRAVTADDYKNLITANFQYAQSVSVWGGEDNDPPQYGRAFVSIKPYSSYEGSILTGPDRNTLNVFLKTKKVLSILPQIVDPEYINIVLDVLFKYDSNIVALSATELQDAVATNVLDVYNESTLNTFDTIFRHSQFMREVDNYNRAILNSLVRVFVKQDIVIPSSGLRNDIVVNFNVPLTVDDGTAIVEVTSDVPWLENGARVYLGDEAIVDEVYTRNLYAYTVFNQVVTRLRDVGKLDLRTGTMTLNTGLYADNDVTLSVLMLPESNDIVGKRNLLLRIDTNASIVRAYPDEIAVGGSSRSVDYTTFSRERID